MRPEDYPAQDELAEFAQGYAAEVMQRAAGIEAEDVLFGGDVYQRVGSESYNDIRNEMKEIMMSHCGVFRDAERLKVCIETLKGLQERFKKGKVTD